MMKKDMYFSSTLLWGCSLEELFATWKQYGIQNVELWAEQMAQFDLDLKTYRTYAKAQGITTVVHSKSWDLNFASLNEGIRKSSIKEVKKSIDLAALIGAKEITVHPPRQTVNNLDSNIYQYAYEGIKELHLYARERGIVLSLEIMEKIPKEIITSDVELQQVVGDLYEELEYTLDTAHCTDEAEIFAYLENIQNISKIHISNKIGPKLHTPLFDGDYDLKTLIPKLLSYGIPLSVEGMDTGLEYTLLKETVNFIEKLEEETLC